MNHRYLVTMAMLFVCLAVMVRAEEAAAPETVLPDKNLVVFYFHNTWRCQSCNSIESLTRAAIFGGPGENSKKGHTSHVESPFSALADEGILTFEALNIDLAENKPLFEILGNPAKLPVIAEMRGGEVAEFEVFDRVWDLLGDSKAFVAYIQQKAGLFINQAMDMQTSPEE